ncbi:shTK domain protein [Necator americanus]|uniref:ShTK domain protein n=1 Tax=Necator americanus TaxID=51031 RepID=W2TU97_NECAM|nr:shTK domain protein [Necator americanus]ETN84627.1 shTK domain protein [Necator americanus]
MRPLIVLLTLFAAGFAQYGESETDGNDVSPAQVPFYPVKPPTYPSVKPLVPPPVYPPVKPPTYRPVKPPQPPPVYPPVKPPPVYPPVRPPTYPPIKPPPVYPPVRPPPVYPPVKPPTYPPVKPPPVYPPTKPPTYPPVKPPPVYPPVKPPVYPPVKPPVYPPVKPPVYPPPVRPPTYPPVKPPVRPPVYPTAPPSATPPPYPPTATSPTYPVKPPLIVVPPSPNPASGVGFSAPGNPGYDTCLKTNPEVFCKQMVWWDENSRDQPAVLLSPPGYVAYSPYAASLQQSDVATLPTDRNQCMDIPCICLFAGGTYSSNRCNLPRNQYYGMALRKELRMLTDDERLRLEMALRQYDPNVSLPYWDSTLDAYLDDPKASVMWSDELLGYTDSTNSLTTGMFAYWQSLMNRTTVREYGKAVNSRPMAQYLLDLVKTQVNTISDALAFTAASSRGQRENDYPTDNINCSSQSHFSRSIMVPFAPMVNMDGLSNKYTGVDPCYGTCVNGMCQAPPRSSYPGVASSPQQEPLYQEPIVPDESCFNQNPCCATWAVNGGCQKDSVRMSLVCPASCQLCTPKAYALTDDCTDRHHLCSIYKAAGKCASNDKFTAENCRHTCGVCGIPRSTGCL